MRRSLLRTQSWFTGCARRHLGNKSCCRNLSSMYYDSQSGIHVPVHDETKVSIILDTTLHADPFLPLQFYKEDQYESEIPMTIKALRESGIHGILLPPNQFPRDERNVATLSEITPEGFTIFHCTTLATLASSFTKNDQVHINSVFDYQVGDDDNIRNGKVEALRAKVEKKLPTTIALRDNAMWGASSDPIQIANDVASLIDNTGGGQYLWLAPSNRSTTVDDESNNGPVDADQVLQLVEELLYLDLPGPTTKSRLMVDCGEEEEIAEECMMTGINKFVVSDENQITMIEEIAMEQGKRLLRLE